jgi:hypothetical protein
LNAQSLQPCKDILLTDTGSFVKVDHLNSVKTLFMYQHIVTFSFAVNRFCDFLYPSLSASESSFNKTETLLVQVCKAIDAYLFSCQDLRVNHLSANFN